MRSEELLRHVEFLASEPRPAETERLEVCRSYCEQALSVAGWLVRRDSFCAVSSSGESRSGTNLIATCGLSNPQRPTFVLGAHVDSCEQTPGADDNASAVAVLLELADWLNAKYTDKEWAEHSVNLELLVFDLEEHGMLGGAHHAETCRTAERDLLGMVSLEMLGYCDHQPGSQQMPPELADRFPDTGNFIGLVGNQNSGDLLLHFQKAFQLVDRIPCEILRVTENGNTIPPTRLSDHSPFWDAGYPALMMTDTSFLRNPNYHQPTDTPETLDMVFLHNVSLGVAAAVEILLANGLKMGV